MTAALRALAVLTALLLATLPIEGVAQAQSLPLTSEASPVVVQPAIPESPRPSRFKPDIAVDALEGRVLALRVYQLHNEAEVWMNLTAKAVRNFTLVQASNSGAGELKLALDATRLRLSQLDVINAALEDKGGDATEYRLYASSVRSALLTNAGDTRYVGVFLGQALDHISEWRSTWTWVVGTLFLLLATSMISRRAAKLAGQALRRLPGSSRLLRDSLGRIVRIIIWTIGLILTLAYIGIDVTPAFAALGAMALIVGLALQDTVADVVTGFLLLLHRPFDEGDYVQVGGKKGLVVGVHLMNTELRTFDNQHIIVPNKQVWTREVINYAYHPIRRVDLELRVDYSHDVARVHAVIAKIFADHPETLSEPEPIIRYNGFGPSYAIVSAKVWVPTEGYWRARWDLIEQLKTGLQAAGMYFPVPRQDLQVRLASDVEPDEQG